MIVYMSRRHRRAIAQVLGDIYGPDSCELQGSADTIAGALSMALDAVQYVDGEPDDAAFAQEAARLLEVLEDAFAPRYPTVRRLARRLRYAAQRRRRVIRVEFTYQQTAHENIHTDTNDRARAAIEPLCMSVLDDFGSCWFGPGLEELCADNGFEVATTRKQVKQIRRALAAVVGHPETIKVEKVEA